MKRNIITVVLFAVLVTIAVSCQKENLVEPQSTVAEIGTVRTVSYTIDGVTNQIILQNDAEWDAFVDSMLSLSAQGHDVRFVNESASVQELPTKDVQTITTPDQEKAKAWSKEKADQGYTVSTTYANGQYTVIAIKQSANAAKCRLQEKYPRDEIIVTELGNVSLYEIKEISKK